MNGVAVGVGQDLNLDVSRPANEFFDEYRTVAKGGLGLAAAALECLGHVLGAFDRAHAASARRLRPL